MTDAVPVAVRSTRSRLSSPGAIRLSLLLYGLVLALWSVERFDTSVPDQATLMQSRQMDLERSQRALSTGGPPLLACLQDYDDQRPLDGCYPAGKTDDQGIYLYLPLFAEATGIDSPELALKWLFITLFALLAFVAPLIFYALFESVLAGLFAGAAIVFHFDVFANTDIYWFSAWCYLLAVPLLLLVYKRWAGPRSAIALAGVVAIGSFATSVRIHAGLPILLGALIVAILRRRSVLTLTATVAALVVAYFSFGLLLEGAREYRDRAVGDPSLSEKFPTRHPFWHNVYIGLGYLPNRYGIEWNDSIGAATVERLNPEAAYLSPEYERTLRDEVFRIAREDPSFVIDNIVTKLGLAFKVARDQFGIVLLLAPFAMFYGRTRREWRRYLLIAAPTLLVSLPPPVLTMPLAQYQVGWLGAWATLWLLLACWAIAVLPNEVHASLAEHDVAARVRRGPLAAALKGARAALRSPATWLAVALIALVAVFADVIGPRADRVADNDFWRAGAEELVAPVQARPLHDWPFDKGLPATWMPIAVAGTDGAPGGLKVITNDGRFEYQIASPTVALPAGNYEARARVKILAGALELGALDATKNAWLNTTHYWQGQNGFATHDLATPFTLARPESVRVILSNWHARPRQSIWIVERVWIRRA